jgi:hypothetical protein
MAIIVNNSFEEEQKRRAEAARARGMDEASIQKFQLIDRIKQQQTQPQQSAQQTSQTTQTEANKPSNLKKFLVNTGAIAGQIGAGIGSLALAPVTGGASLAGGFAAGAGIEALRRKLLGEKQNLAASALEGGLTILPGVVEGVKALRGAKVVGELAGAGKAAAAGTKGVVAATEAALPEKQGLKEFIAKQFKPTNEANGITNKVSQSLSKQSTIAPTSTIGEASTQNKLIKFSQEESKLRGSSYKKFQNVESVIADKTNQVDELLKGVKKTIPSTELNKSITEAVAGISDPSEQKNFVKIIGRIEKKIGSKTEYTPTDINTARREINKELGSVMRKKEMGSTLTAGDRALLDSHASFTEVLNKLAPDNVAAQVKDLNSRISTFIEGIPEFKKASESANVLGIKGGVLPKVPAVARGVQSGADYAGRGLNMAAKVVSTPVVKTGVTQGIARSLTKPYLEAPVNSNIMQTQPDGSFVPANGATNDTFNINDLSAQFSQAGITDPQQMFEALNAAEQPQQDTQKVAENPLGISSGDLFKQAYELRLKGDTKGSADILNFAKVAQEFEAAAAKGKDVKGLNSTASGVVADTTTGLKSLKNLSQKLSESNVNNPIIGQIRGKNPLDTNAQKLQADIQTTKQIVGKALEGGVLRKEDEVKYAKILPTLGDTEATAQYKINALINLISSRLEEYKSSLAGGSGGIDITDFNQGATQ